ncbi:zinc-responsive transcriptional regulator ZAP1 [Rhypophila decipiens]|uniref:Zinc-responsive transcriptional regulator ZAP1 n=1 Tax=Rhypophila decipiens TaxID=261697 RepID=A0AAN6YJ75_9PEZI|nr:zinc-responsive transcriptional regulator ZAP1 [Rhypophila decipiens]
MDNPFIDPESFKYHHNIHRNIFPTSPQGPRNHHHSQSLTQLSHAIDYSMMNSQQLLHTQQPPNDNGFSRLPSANAHESHDDLCVDQCSGVGLYNGSQYFNHRGPPHGVPLGWPTRGMSSRHDPGVLYNYSSDVDTNPFSWRGSAHASGSDVMNHSWYSPLEPDHRGADDDCQSMADSCCDSQCTMVGKCTNIACANKDDACTDQNCPSRPVDVPPEVASGAAALISITHAPEPSYHGYSLQSPGLNTFGFGISHHAQQALLGLPNLLPNAFGHNFAPIIDHALVAHSDPDSSSCTRSPCLLDDPRNYGNGNCHLPLVYQNPALFNRLHSIMEEPDMQMNPIFPECGAEISNPEAFLEHYNQQHRPSYKELVSSLQDSLQVNPRPQQGQAIASNGTNSRSPATPFDTSDSGASANTPSPLTPLSHSVEMADVKQTHPSPSRSMTEESESGTVDMEADREHRCLWRENPTADVCGQIFADSGELFDHSVNRHIKHAVKGPDGFSCGWLGCPRSAQGASGFPQRSKIERHMQTHIGHKPHVCSLCGKGFSAKQALNQHMFIHRGEKPLECNVCHKTFRYPSALTMHQRIHTGIKPLKCPVCGKMFSESSNLSKHKRTHEQRGRFSCAFPGCNRDFHRQDQLRRHAKTHYKESDSKSTTEIMTSPKIESVF